MLHLCCVCVLFVLHLRIINLEPMSKQANIHLRCDKSIKEKAKRDAFKKLGTTNLTHYIVWLINKEE